MPSIADQLHTLGALMKTNLERKGVTGLTTSMGLTTLANKILDIDCQGGGGDGLYLSGSSSIIQIDETCTLNAVLLSNNTPVENELIVLYSNKDSPIPVDSADITNFELKFGNINASMEFGDIIPVGVYVDYNASNNKITIRYSYGNEEIIEEMDGTVLYKVGTTFFTDFGDSITVPSNLATLSERSRSGIQANDFKSIISAGFTNVGGVVTADYVGTGAGDVTVYAKCNLNGSFLQETYELQDLWRYDTSNHSTSNEVVNWDLPLGNFEITAYIHRGTGGAYIYIGDTSTRILFGHTGSSNICSMYLNNTILSNGTGNDYIHTLQIIDGVAYYTVNGNTVQGNVPSGIQRKLYQFTPWGNSTISNIKIKQL